MEAIIIHVHRAGIQRDPLQATPVFFGVHSEIAQHYGVDINVHEPHAATLDYVVAAAAG